MQLQLGAQNTEQAGVVPGLLDEVAGTAAHGVHGQVNAGPCGHQDHGQAAVLLADRVEQLQTFRAGGGVARVVQIDQQSVVVTLLQAVEHQRG